MTIKALIFDLDDTLYQEIQFIYSGFSEVAQHLSKKYSLSYNFVYNELVNDFKKGIRKKNFNVLLKKIDKNDDELPNLIDTYRYHIPKIFLCEDAQVVLKILQNRYKLGLITDGYICSQENKIDALGIRSFFNYIIINNIEKGIDKLSENPFKVLINLLEVPPDTVIFIGDNPQKDFFVPQKLGLLTIRIRRPGGIYANIPTNDSVNIEISSLIELPNILDRIEKNGENNGKKI